jgi:hypothetical protein
VWRCFLSAGFLHRPSLHDTPTLFTHGKTQDARPLRNSVLANILALAKSQRHAHPSPLDSDGTGRAERVPHWATIRLIPSIHQRHHHPSSPCHHDASSSTQRCVSTRHCLQPDERNIDVTEGHSIHFGDPDRREYTTNPTRTTHRLS